MGYTLVGSQCSAAAYAMPKSEYLVSALRALLDEYGAAFPSSEVKGTMSLHTHITPGEERIKKLLITVPCGSSGMPMVSGAIFQDGGKKTSLVMTLIDLLHGAQATRRLRASLKDRAANRRVADEFVKELRAVLWRVGPAKPDHFAE